METEKDFEELFALFNRYRVRYCIVGAYAVAFHSRPRYTKDLDIFVEPNLRNARRILKALEAFGFGKLALSAEDFSKRNQVIQLGYEPLRIDLLTSIPGVGFEPVWKHRVKGYYGGQSVSFISLADLIKNKRAAKRRQDLADLQLLEQVQAGKRKNRA